MTTYEQRLSQDERWALSEGSKHFQDEGSVHETLQRICARLAELGIAYAVVGGMALFHHGVRRFTEDVDILVTREGLRAIHQALEGKGYLPKFRHSKNLRDTKTGVSIEFLIAGEYPGDGKPKPVAFPNPPEVTPAGGIRYLGLRELIELKLASGISASDRLKDLADVSALIKVLHLPQRFAEDLSEYVRPKYLDLWKDSQTRYVTLWRNKRLAAEAHTIEEMSRALAEAAALLSRMQADGVVMDPESTASDDHVYLVTTDPEVAARYDMHPEAEFWGEPGHED